jgi:hypothetical protein
MRLERRKYPNCSSAHRAGEVLEGVLPKEQEAVEFDEVGGSWVQLQNCLFGEVHGEIAGKR